MTRFAHLATEFPDYPLDSLPDIPEGWEDISWHNDVCPSFEPAPGVSVFIDFPDVIDREFQDDSIPRFAVHVGVDDEDIQSLHTDDWDAVLAYVRQVTRPLPAREALEALKALVGSLVSEAVPDAEVAATLAHIPGCGDIIPAVLKARAVIGQAKRRVA